MADMLHDGQDIRLWPGAAPGSEGLRIAETIVDRPDDGSGRRDRAWEMVLNPLLLVATPAKPNGAAIVLAPGGGYRLIVVDKEGLEFAAPLTAAGYTVFILKYRLPGDGHGLGADLPLVDAQRAVRLVRANAAAWGLDPGRIGLFGCSAGGHLAALGATRFADRVTPAVDAIDAADARPDFAVLLYPVITMQAGVTHAGSRERLLGAMPSAADITAASLETRVMAATPPTLLIHAQDDAAVPVENALRFYDALRAAGVPAELHVFPESGHGFALRSAKGTAKGWFGLTLAWLDEVTRR